MRYLKTSTKSSLVNTGSDVGTSKPNFLFILYLPTAPKSYFFVEKNILSINFCAISTDGASPALSCLYKSSRASSVLEVGSLSKVLDSNSTAILLERSLTGIEILSTLAFFIFLMSEIEIKEPFSRRTSPVFSSTMSSITTLSNRDFSFEIDIFSDRLKRPKISEFVEKPIALKRTVAGNFLLLSMIAYIQS